MRKEELENLGVTGGTLDVFLKTNQIIEKDGVLEVSGDLLVRLFLDNLKQGKNTPSLIQNLTEDKETKMLISLISSLYAGNIEEARIYLCAIHAKYPNNKYQDIVNLYDFILNDRKGDNLRITYDDNEYIGAFVNLVKKYILKHQYAIAKDLLDELLQIDNNIYLQILMRVCTCLSSKTIYIVDESNIKDAATREGIARMERKMLIDLEKGDNLLLNKNFNNLISFDICLDVYENLVSLFKMVNNFRNNYRLLSNRDLRAVYGDLDSVVSALVSSQDFYRLKNVLDQYVSDNKDFSLKVEMYKILINRIMEYNRRNKEYIDRERLTSINPHNEKSLIERYPVSSISVDSIDEETYMLQVDFSKNYYEYYQILYDKKRYLEAKRALLQFKVNMSSLEVNINVDYLLKELDVLIANEKDVNASKVNELLTLADNESNKMQKIRMYLGALKYQTVKNPRIMSKIGNLYYELHNFREALKYYQEADEVFLYPEDYIIMMELFIKCKQYKEVVSVARKYENYYPEENAYIYYLLSIAYANLGYFDLADDALATADAINVAIYNMPVEYAREHEIINNLKNNIASSLYTIDDFVSYDLTKQEKELLGKIDDLKRTDEVNYFTRLKKEGLSKNTIADKIDYLLMVMKVFNYKEDEERVNDLMTFIEALIENEDVPREIKESTEKTLSLYKLN